MLFSTTLTQDDLIQDNPTDLLSQYSADTPSLPSQVSAPSTTASDVSTASPQHSLAVKETSWKPILPFDSSAAGNLVDCALQTLIVGYYPKIRLHPGIKIEKPTPGTSLSALVPTIFNPGYRQVRILLHQHHQLTNRSS